MKKIIVISNDIWENSDETWGFDTFSKNGYHVEIWRVGALTSCTKIWTTPHFDYPVITIKSYRELIRRILTMSIHKPMYLFYIAGEQHLDKEKALIRIMGGQYCNVSIGPLGSRNNHLRLKEVSRTEHHWMDWFPAKYNFLGAEIHKCGLHSKYEIEKGNNIMLHIYDYDCYLRNQKFELKEDDPKEYILYYDQNFLEHKDITNFGLRKWIPNEKVYISEIQGFLDDIEKYFKLPIVIAAHPTAAQSDLKKIYGDRKIVYGNTCGYTKNSKFVIAFTSGAINYAVLYKKPILFWTCYQLKNTDLYLEWQCVKCSILKGRILNISSKSNKNYEDYLTNPQNYEKFLGYITADKNENRLFFDIVVDYLNKGK